MNLIELLAWAQVELQAEKPNVDQVRQALWLALEQAAKLNINFDIKTKAVIHMAQVYGGDEIIGGMR